MEKIIEFVDCLQAAGFSDAECVRMLPEVMPDTEEPERDHEEFEAN